MNRLDGKIRDRNGSLCQLSFGAGEIRWDPATGVLDVEALERLDAVVHLAGENIASGRWTAGKIRRIRESRIQGTHVLAQSLARIFDPPKVLISISATGYYSDRGEETLDEEGEAGTGYGAGRPRDHRRVVCPPLSKPLVWSPNR